MSTIELAPATEVGPVESISNRPSAQDVAERAGGVSLMEYLARELSTVDPDLMPKGWSTRVGGDADADTTG